MEVGYLTKAEFAAGRLRKALISGKYKPGEHLAATRVARELGLSITPVREALFELANEGLVVTAPHRGARVAEFSPAHLRDVFELRALLESHATGLAAERISVVELETILAVQHDIATAVADGKSKSLAAFNEDFHFQIYAAAGSPILMKAIQQAWRSAPHDLFVDVPKRGEKTVHDHDRIVDALKTGDATAAATAMGDHIRNSCALHLGLRARTSAP